MALALYMAWNPAVDVGHGCTSHDLMGSHGSSIEAYSHLFDVVNHKSDTPIVYIYIYIIYIDIY